MVYAWLIEIIIFIFIIIWHNVSFKKKNVILEDNLGG